MSLWRQKSWLLLTISSAILLLSFWPLIGGISLLNNWVAALVWLGVGWALTVDLQHSSAEHSA